MKLKAFKELEKGFIDFKKGETKYQIDSVFDMHKMTSDAINELLVKGAGMMSANEVFCCYGVYRGASLLPVAWKNPNVRCIGVDNWSKFDADGKNKGIIDGYIKKLGIKNIELFEVDFKDYFKNCQDKIGLLFADGDHSYEATLEALELADPVMGKNGIIIIDDTDRQEVKNAVNEFVKRSGYKLLWDMAGTKEIKDRHMAKAWWSGVMVIHK